MYEIIFSVYDMSHPTSFFILENEELGQFWIGQMKMKLDECGFSLLPALTRDELMHKLETKYVEYAFPCLDLVSINKNGTMPFYGIEKWVTDLQYEIKRNPEKFRKVKKLLTTGWHEDDFTGNSTVNVLHARNKTDMKELYRRLIRDWEAKGMRCLNAHTCKTKAEKYQDKKKDPDFLKAISRKKVLRQMEKTGKMPKQSTVEKYELKNSEIKEVMGRKGIIYKITSPSGKVYVGQTIKKFNDRISQHKSKTSNCTLVKRAIDKYKDQMKYEIIDENIPLEQLDEREIYWIKELNSLAPNGYNCNSGGDAQHNISQETRDKLRDRVNKAKIERDGYLGDVQQTGNVFYPRVRPNGKKIYLSNGSFHTKEQAIEVLKEYTKDPENFTKVDGTVQRSIGCVYKDGNRWKLSYKSKHLGCYETEEEAREALERYIKDPGNFVKPMIKLGCIYRNGPSWGLTYKHKYIGTYPTQEEAEEARKTLQSSTYSSSSESA